MARRRKTTVNKTLIRKKASAVGRALKSLSKSLGKKTRRTKRRRSTRRRRR